MILVEVKPRQDNLFDIYIGDEGDHFVNSNQGYEHVEDAIAIVRKFWPPLTVPEGLSGDERAWFGTLLHSLEPVVLRVTYRNGKTHTEQLR